jgi:prepilin-type N-terminal cleavage/methylation domain-containing protein
MRLVTAKATKTHPDHSEVGFSLLELTVVVTVLGILSSVALPQIGNMVNGSKVDGVSAKLNAVAADCLQKTRISSDTTVDNSIISNENLKSQGYIIDPTNTSCTSFGVKPINDSESLLFPMSFAIVSGRLTKSGQPTGPASISYCKNWAGILCTEGEGLKTLVNHMAAIKKSKDTCDAALAKNKADKITAGPINKWNPNATSGCPTRPPVDTTSETCTINGCLNNPVWLVEGVEYTSKTDADAAETILAGAKCIEGLSDKTDPSKGGNPTLTEQGVRPDGCTKDYYFAEGKRFDNEPAWKSEMCSINIKQKQDTNNTDPSAPSQIEHCANDRQFYFCAGEDKGNNTDYQACLIENKSAACGVAIDQVRQTGGNGKHTNPTAGPTPCGTSFWVCDQPTRAIHDSEEKYKETNCGKKKECGLQPIWYCTDPGSEYKGACAAWTRCKNGE